MAKAPPRRRDAQATRAGLLETAGRAFAEHGYDGARIDDIAARAGVNKRMIYAYFGDKDGLYRAVLDAHLTLALAAADPTPAGARAAPREEVEALVRRFFAFLSEHEDFVRLMGWEALSRARRGRRLLTDRIAANLDAIHAVLRRGVAQGAFRADLDPRTFTMSVGALFLGYFMQRPFLEALWSTDLRAVRAREAVLRDFVRLLLDGIGA
ncbi:TetR/AcrR family transcriptional regulator [Anaeromyxobacter dehalogenans]|uniref:Transcriptional regulator, TetR family n=1 Tax=Anaeromyxobacter dehalogenans (strain 2CP-C) TaxID=290397 RepID=Q2IQ80_ANADE|nr:TetR/AcrR family transcriptional regulator [Anaeromyxobacter dehalogenans]ABC80964.1 transcriptional regulator, TetR family [Anaeromyxobacter dehalogenans 2CP-C]